MQIDPEQKLHPRERRKILRRILKNHEIAQNTLAKFFGVSDATISRDVQMIEEKRQKGGEQ